MAPFLPADPSYTRSHAVLLPSKHTKFGSIFFGIMCVFSLCEESLNVVHVTGLHTTIILAHTKACRLQLSYVDVRVQSCCLFC